MEVLVFNHNSQRLGGQKIVLVLTCLVYHSLITSTGIFSFLGPSSPYCIFRWMVRKGKYSRAGHDFLSSCHTNML